jgi:phospholipid/cholesterol/gamma-HCH transport system substrate-binding protein
LRPAREDELLRSQPSAELADVISQVGDAVKGIQGGKGTLGKLAQDQKAYDALVALLTKSAEAVEKSKDTLDSIERSADAVKRLPVVGRYVEDPVALLVRTNCERNRQHFAEDELFEPGRAVLTAGGRERLDRIAPWLAGLKHKGSEVVVVSYADPKKSRPKTALAVTRQQSQAVVDYLKKHHAVHKMGLLSTRKVTPLGQGVRSPPAPERDPLPAARVEVLVFVPQG